MTRTFDAKCFDLAQAFLKETPTDTAKTYDHKCSLLAAEIQETIEEWFRENPDLQMR